MITELEAKDTIVRWTATVLYRSDAGTIDVTHDLIELHELQDLIERGPHWDAISEISIKRAAVMIEGLTIEAAERL